MRRSCTSMMRNLIRNNKSLPLSPLLNEALMSPATITASSYSKPFSISTLTPTVTTSSTLHRNLCSSPSGPSNIVVINSEEKFNSSLRKVQDEALPGILYFTAVWCGPCRLLSPIIGQLSEKYPHVTTYKIDIDQEGLEGTLSNLNIHSVPTLHFFKEGKKVSEVIGADVQRLKDTMENLYK